MNKKDTKLLSSVIAIIITWLIAEYIIHHLNKGEIPVQDSNDDLLQNDLDRYDKKSIRLHKLIRKNKNLRLHLKDSLEVNQMMLKSLAKKDNTIDKLLKN